MAAACLGSVPGGEFPLGVFSSKEEAKFVSVITGACFQSSPCQMCGDKKQAAGTTRRRHDTKKGGFEAQFLTNKRRLFRATGSKKRIKTRPSAPEAHAVLAPGDFLHQGD